MMLQKKNRWYPITLLTTHKCLSIVSYHMATCSSMSQQDEPNPLLWLGTQAGKMVLSCLLGITCCLPHEKKKKKPWSHIINPLLTKLIWSRWLDIGQGFFFCMSLDLNPISSISSNLVHKHPKKKYLGQCPAILTACLVNTPHIMGRVWLSASLRTPKSCQLLNFGQLGRLCLISDHTIRLTLHWSSSKYMKHKIQFNKPGMLSQSEELQCLR